MAVYDVIERGYNLNGKLLKPARVVVAVNDSSGVLMRAFGDDVDELNPENTIEILGVSRNASDDDIRKAYRRLVKEWHPDAYKV